MARQAAKRKAQKLPNRTTRITPHACDECRRKRVKCDGKTPCRRCVLRNVPDCTYSYSKSQLKGELRAEIQSLRGIISKLVDPQDEQRILSTASARDVLPDELASIRSASIADDLADDIRRASDAVASKDETSKENIHVFMSRSTERPSGSSFPLRKRSTNIAATIAGTQASSSQSLPSRNARLLDLPETWTSLTNDLETVHYYIALYFCWEYPSFAPINKEPFLRDFHNSRQQYCSPMLVNALLALSSQLSDRFRDIKPSSGKILSSHDFFAEANKLFSISSDHHSITTIQTLGILSLHQARAGRISESRYYSEQAMLLAIEMGLHTQAVFSHAHYDADTMSKVFWGIYTLEHTWALMMGNLPRCTSSVQLPPKPTVLEHVETSSWSPYVDGRAPLKPHIQLSNVRSVYQNACTLAQLIAKSVKLLNTPGQPVIASSLLSMYHEYLHWYEKIPDLMRLGQNSTPAVLSVQYERHSAQNTSARYLLTCQITIKVSSMSTLKVCLQPANAILRLATSYSNLYTFRRAPTFLPYFLFGAASIYARSFCTPNNNPVMTEEKDRTTFKECIENLEQMIPYNAFAKKALDVLCDAADQLGICISISGIKAPFCAEGPLKATFQPTLAAPDIQNMPCTCRSSDALGSRSDQIKANLFRKADPTMRCLTWLQHDGITPIDDELSRAGFQVTPLIQPEAPGSKQAK